MSSEIANSRAAIDEVELGIEQDSWTPSWFPRERREEMGMGMKWGISDAEVSEPARCRRRREGRGQRR